MKRSLVNVATIIVMLHFTQVIAREDARGLKALESVERCFDRECFHEELDHEKFDELVAMNSKEKRENGGNCKRKKCSLRTIN